MCYHRLNRIEKRETITNFLDLVLFSHDICSDLVLVCDAFEHICFLLMRLGTQMCFAPLALFVSCILQSDDCINIDRDVIEDEALWE